MVAIVLMLTHVLNEHSYTIDTVHVIDRRKESGARQSHVMEVVLVYLNTKDLMRADRLVQMSQAWHLNSCGSLSTLQAHRSPILEQQPSWP